MMDKTVNKLKLDIAKNILMIDLPEEIEGLFEKIKYVSFPTSLNTGNYDYVQIFAKSVSGLKSSMEKYSNSGMHDCYFWVCYPKGGGKIKSDIKRDSLSKTIALFGFQTVTQVAIDETWSAMRIRPVDSVGKSKTNLV